MRARMTTARGTTAPCAGERPRVPPAAERFVPDGHGAEILPAIGKVEVVVASPATWQGVIWGVLTQPAAPQRGPTD
jgi:hypothetical protein